MGCLKTFARGKDLALVHGDEKGTGPLDVPTVGRIEPL
jgi:hypothetical protein